ncbi:hypothetical protein L1987_47171 [Smallanthus sonchifolius]|uniref:Uncharacterized protein n=1 Tax=Smallanthus sonchifolius TaxID=185202 RepID=A0ACB9G2V8_9ASTR|nr:hypothetical protein L1987_47171 [Smallanthus sonchifolius]
MNLRIIINLLEIKGAIAAKILKFYPAPDELMALILSWYAILSLPLQVLKVGIGGFMSNRPSIPKGSTTPIDYVYIQYADGVAKLPVKQASKFLYCYNLMLICLENWAGSGPVELSEAARAGVKAISDWVMESMNKGTDSYGVTTGRAVLHGLSDPASSASSSMEQEGSGNVTVELGGGEKEVSRCINCDGAGALTCTACQGSAHAIADEMHKVYTKELRPTPVPLTVDGEVIDEEDMYFLDANNESDDDVEGKDVDEKDGADLEKREAEFFAQGNFFKWSFPLKKC